VQVTPTVSKPGTPPSASPGERDELAIVVLDDEAKPTAVGHHKRFSSLSLS
jgi:hypothetical protein